MNAKAPIMAKMAGTIMNPGVSSPSPELLVVVV
jgi:hypothetical protein